MAHRWHEVLHAIKIDSAEQIVAEKECKYDLFDSGYPLSVDAYTTIFD